MPHHNKQGFVLRHPTLYNIITNQFMLYTHDTKYIPLNKIIGEKGIQHVGLGFYTNLADIKFLKPQKILPSLSNYNLIKYTCGTIHNYKLNNLTIPCTTFNKIAYLNQKAYEGPTQLSTLNTENGYLDILKTIQHTNLKLGNSAKEICEQTLLAGDIFRAIRGKYLIEVLKIPEDIN